MSALTVGLSGKTLVAASAGAGKTHTITTLVLRLLLERDLGIGEILVVTYTRAATAELRDRVRRRLRDAAKLLDGERVDDVQLGAYFRQHRDGAQRQADRGRIRRALQDFDEAAIFTIHGFCQRVLAEYAFESGAPFDLDFLEDQAGLEQEVALDYRARHLYEAAPALVKTVERGLDATGAWTRLVSLAATFPGLEVLTPPADESLDLEDLERRWFECRDGAVAQWQPSREQILALLLEPGVLNGNSYKAKTIAVGWAPALDAMAEAEPRGMPACMQNLGVAVLEKRTNKGQTTPRHPFFEAAQHWFEADEALNGALALQVSQLRAGMVAYASRELGERKQRAAVQSFDDLLVRLDGALGGEGAAALAARIRGSYRAALVDEFQDTDPVQYRILSRIYRDGEASVFLIGDPKQAIYGFRGADIFAYLRAVDDVEHEFPLEHNWRSDPDLLQGLNHLFGRVEQPFLYPQISYTEVKPRPGAENRLQRGAAGGPSLELLLLPTGTVAGDKAINKGEVDGMLPDLVAGDIVRLLQSDWQLEGEPLGPRHVAVLCRTNKQARQVQAALRTQQVPSVLEGDDSVFDAPMASELERVLWAMAEPGDGALVRSALATSLLGVSGLAIHGMHMGEDPQWDVWLDRFGRWHQRWQREGFVQAFHHMLDEVGVHRRLLARLDGERCLTDLLHLSELLHGAASREHLGPLALLHWLTRMRVDAQQRGGLAGESTQVRLESDAQAVRLTTIHKSKGLEYPIVYCPYLWDKSELRRGEKEALKFHDLQDPQCPVKLDLGSQDSKLHKGWAEREVMAESLRLLYVALTRAKHHCVVVWDRIHDCDKSALGTLLHASNLDAQADDVGKATKRAKATKKATDVMEPWLTAQALSRLDACRARIKALTSEAELKADLDRLVEGSLGSIGWRQMAGQLPPPYVVASATDGLLAARQTTRTHPPFFRTTSFSGLTAGADHGSAALVEVEVPDHDELQAREQALSIQTAQQGPQVRLAQFPRGARPGNLIHHVFEHLDFQAPKEAVRDQSALSLERFGYATDGGRLLVPELADAVWDVLHTPIHGQPGGFCLADIAPADRLNEMEFMFPVSGQSRAASQDAALVTPLALGEVFRAHAAPACAPEYGARIAELGFVPVTGYLKGYVDLIVRHGGRYYVVDYKSNFLGERAGAYRPEQLLASMESSHYYLQYHLYTVAVHRHLRLRLAEYDYQRHFGGVLYLFVRGMAPEHAAGTGVYRDRPQEALVDALDRVLGQGGEP